eukprot:Plantae.Rhodophyta-Rhodochaete_pulchella.ctg2609.p2 GENE.Plantae.Rhodophyta-Rhodochaete_pulchella.ctg2609~~Plantae.Rhodophyta-Rhodochaete_pulchella.ctg2609.p2  ORF type:complete len:275 (+),score=39.73 Plantae.Rhodophyta-Rhodochaete_pulchella.ctg2609:1549-2373(+)
MSQGDSQANEPLQRGLSYFVDQLNGGRNGSSRIDAACKAIQECRERQSQVLDLQQLGLREDDFTANIIDDILALKDQVRVLNLFFNELAEIPQWVGQFTHLEELHCGCNPLTKADGLVLSPLQNLRELDLGYSEKLTNLPAAIGDLRSLRVCWLANNRLESLPLEMFKLTAMEELHLFGNDLKGLPDEIGNMASLRVLNAGRNQLTKVPEAVGKLTNLETLHLYENDLDSLPVALSNLPKLKVLSTHGNGRMRVPPRDVLHQGVQAVARYYSCP